MQATTTQLQLRTLEKSFFLTFKKLISSSVGTVCLLKEDDNTQRAHSGWYGGGMAKKREKKEREGVMMWLHASNYYTATTTYGLHGSGEKPMFLAKGDSL